jgi:hypothetical protein
MALLQNNNNSVIAKPVSQILRKKRQRIGDLYLLYDAQPSE